MFDRDCSCDHLCINTCIFNVVGFLSKNFLLIQTQNNIMPVPSKRVKKKIKLRKIFLTSGKTSISAPSGNIFQIILKKDKPFL